MPGHSVRSRRIIRALLILPLTALLAAGCRHGNPIGSAPDDPGWPAHLTAPAGPLPTLPTDRAVGRAQLLYRCPGCPHWTIRLADGREYALPATADHQFGSDTTVGGQLSPDGRWLVLPGCDGDAVLNRITIRDLTGTATRCRPSRPQAWSANGRYLLGNDGQLLDLTSTASWTAAIGNPEPDSYDGGLAGILDDGTLVVTGEPENPFTPPSLPAGARSRPSRPPPAPAGSPSRQRRCAPVPGTGSPPWSRRR